MGDGRDLDTHLRQLATRLQAEVAEPGIRLVGLLPCEPAVGEVAVACWVDDAGGERYGLVRLDDGERLDDSTALREAFTLLGMAETLEELADRSRLASMAEALTGWRRQAEAAPEALAMAPELVRALDGALAAIGDLHDAAPEPTRARVAGPERLEALGAGLRRLETAWMLLEQAAETWTERAFAVDAEARDARELAQQLWAAMLLARQGPLAQTSVAAVQAGREAGAALAAAVAAAAQAAERR